MEIFGQILGLGFSLMSSVISIIFTFMLVIVAGVTATLKGRNGFFWGIATIFFPWVLIVLFILPRKYPKFQNKMNQREEFRGKNPVIASIMSLAAIVAKSDGNITENEISTIKRFVQQNFRVSSEELKGYKEVFDYAKDHPEEYREYTKVIMSYYRRRDLVMAISYLLVSVAMTDGAISEKEDAQILAILQEMGISAYEYTSIKNSFTQQQSYGYSGNAFENDSDKLRKYSNILDVDLDADLSEVKKAYREKAKAYHPDKMASQGMGDDYIKYSTEKLAEVNEAYEYLKKVKSA